MKESTAYAVVEKNDVPQNRNVLSDEVVELVSPGADTKCPYPLRRVAVWDEEKEREIVLLTNHLEFGATTISAIYRDRWKIELFFKALRLVPMARKSLRDAAASPATGATLSSSRRSWTAGRRMKGNLLRALPLSGLFRPLNISIHLGIPAVLGQQCPYSFRVEGASFRALASESSGGMRSDSVVMAGPCFTARTM
ncbi:MAG TPA: hypothetical protein VE129_05870 [Thermoanaerobaculia bacterium]|nr:hypothetical protein [Thermoanaerobaculia bacterium]